MLSTGYACDLEGRAGASAVLNPARAGGETGSSVHSAEFSRLSRPGRSPAREA